VELGTGRGLTDYQHAARGGEWALRLRRRAAAQSGRTGKLAVPQWQLTRGRGSEGCGEWRWVPRLY